jgi:hypothetical protein
MNNSVTMSYAWLVDVWMMDSWSGNEQEYKVFKTKEARDGYIHETNKDLGKGAVPEFYVRANLPRRNDGRVLISDEIFKLIDDKVGRTIVKGQFYE